MTTLRSPRIVAKAIVKHRGILARAAEELGVTRQALYRYCCMRPSVWKSVQNGIEWRIDHAETELQKHIDDGDLDAIKFFLKTIGKRRGYMERTEKSITMEQTKRVDVHVEITQRIEEITERIVREALDRAGEVSGNGRRNGGSKPVRAALPDAGATDLS